MKSDQGAYLVSRLHAQRRNTWIQIAAVLGAVACIAAAALLHKPINRQRQKLQLVMNSNIYKELPPQYAWITAAGGTFRGLAADMLWMRADELKQEGKYYESHQLAKWICTLQPRFATVWGFQAWNMSYNISVATHTARERWQWVYNGIRLLRDEGIPNNERVVPLYHQLAWTWFHKVGDRADDFHWSYKRTWAAIMQTLLGTPPAGASRTEQIDWFRPVANAPTRLEKLIEAQAGVRQLVKQFNELGLNVEASTNNQRIFHPLEEQFFRPYTTWLQAKKTATIRAKSVEYSEQQQKLNAFFESAPQEDFNALLAYLRAKVLREQYKMDPAFMLELTGKLGTDEPLPIEWRSPWSQSLYWAMYGVKRGEELNNYKEFDIINTDRIMMFSLATLAKSGRYIFQINQENYADSFLAMMPDLRYVEAMHKKYLEMGKKHADPDEVVGDTAGEMLRSGHVNNIISAIVAYYLSGNVDSARKYLDYLAVNYKNTFTKQTEEMYLLPVDEFVFRQIADLAGSYHEAVHMINMLLRQSYLSLAGGYLDEYSAAIRNATRIYAKYQKTVMADPEGRRTFPPFVQMRAAALREFVLSTEFPMEMRSLAWMHEQNDVKQECWNLVAPDLKEEATAAQIDVTKAFPEPAGMAQWRTANPQREQPEDLAQKQREEQQKAKEQLR